MAGLRDRRIDEFRALSRHDSSDGGAAGHSVRGFRRHVLCGRGLLARIRVFSWAGRSPPSSVIESRSRPSIVSFGRPKSCSRVAPAPKSDSRCRGSFTTASVTTWPLCRSRSTSRPAGRPRRPNPCATRRRRFRQLLADVRRVVDALRPPLSLALEPALKALAATVPGLDVRVSGRFGAQRAGRRGPRPVFGAHRRR